MGAVGKDATWEGVEAMEASDCGGSKQVNSSTENVSCLLVKDSSPQTLNACTQHKCSTESLRNCEDETRFMDQQHQMDVSTAFIAFWHHVSASDAERDKTQSLPSIRHDQSVQCTGRELKFIHFFCRGGKIILF